MKDKNGSTMSNSFKLFLLLVGTLFFLAIIYAIAMGNNIIRVQVNGNSMSPTLESGKSVWVTKNYGTIQRGELVYFQLSEKDCVTSTGCEYIKRIIGVPGDTVTLKDGKIFVNDIELNESYLEEPGTTLAGEALRNNETILLKANEYFILGDNRNFSYDSRNFGPVPKDLILGKPL